MTETFLDIETKYVQMAPGEGGFICEAHCEQTQVIPAPDEGLIVVCPHLPPVKYVIQESIPHGQSADFRGSKKFSDGRSE